MELQVENPTTDSLVPNEVIDGILVHPAASVMPPMRDDEFEKLVESIAERGLGEAIELRDGWLVEGRHRLKAVVLLRERGIPVEARKQPWQPLPGETVADYVLRKNETRRHLTRDQSLQCAADLFAMAEKERASAAEAGRFKVGEVHNPHGRNQYTSASAGADGETESTTPSERKARNRKKTENSRAGRFAKRTGASMHESRQTLKILDLGTPEEIAAVKSGVRKRRDVVKKIDERQSKEPSKKKQAVTRQAKPIDHPYKPSNDLEQQALKVWVAIFKKPFGIADKDEVLATFKAIRKAEQAGTGGAK